jgi:hypothetical protein
MRIEKVPKEKNKLLLGAAMAKIFISYAREIEETAEIVRRVEKLFAYAERLEARYLSANEWKGEDMSRFPYQWRSVLTQ